MFNFSRYSQFGKEFRWQVEQKVFRRFYDNHMVTRNNAMEKPVSFAANYRNSVDADWLQEYFIPLQQLPKFIEKLREVVEKNKINLLNVTIRYVPAEKDFLLSYAKSDSFAVVLYFNQNVSLNNISKAEVWTRDLINAALALKGNYYLPYQPMATREQFQQAYPAYQQFLQVKKKYDPQGLFQSQFYLKYLAG